MQRIHELFLILSNPESKVILKLKKTFYNDL